MTTDAQQQQQQQQMFPLEMFRMLARADDKQQSMWKDFEPLVENPNPIWMTLLMTLLLSQLRTLVQASSSTKHKHLAPSWKVTSFWILVFAAAYQCGFDIGIPPLAVIPNNNNHSNSSNNATTTNISIYKPYTNYTLFYQEAYADAHQEPSSRISHVLLVLGVLLTTTRYDTRLLIPSFIALLIGSLSTIPLASSDMAYLEFLVILFVGMAVSRIWYNSMVSWLVFFLTWASLDYLDHVVLGRNGSVGMYLGRHYISWALVGQWQLAVGIVYQMVLDALALVLKL